MTSCVGAVLALVMASSATAQRVSCKDIAAAMLKHATTPYHMYMTRAAVSDGEKEHVSEAISAGGWLYNNVERKWIKSGMSVQDMVAEERASADSVSRLYTCTRIGSENVNGVAAQRYHIEGNSDDGVKKEELWLSGDGLIQQIAIGLGADRANPKKAFMTVRYVYSNVQVPAGVK